MSKLIKKVGGALCLLAIIFFVATGKLNWLFALIGVFVAFMTRMFPFFIRYMPQLHGLWMAFTKNTAYSSSRSTENPKQSTGKMTRQEACEVLGVALSATEKEIIMAHKKLMQKLHPDKGGSDYFAAKINQAKKILLQK